VLFLFSSISFNTDILEFAIVDISAHGTFDGKVSCPRDSFADASEAFDALQIRFIYIFGIWSPVHHLFRLSKFDFRSMLRIMAQNIQQIQKGTVFTSSKIQLHFIAKILPYSADDSRLNVNLTISPEGKKQ
jgi:hypothetical protein